MDKLEKPVLLYDGECGFCRAWVKRWRHITAGRVDYETSQEAAHRFAHIPKDKFNEAVVFIQPDGTVSYAAHAVFRALSYAPRQGFWLKLYERFPLWSRISEFFYALIARRRTFFSRLTRILWGDASIPSTYHTSRWVFLKLLGLIYFAAFISLWVQAEGLYGSNGVSPLNAYLDQIRAQLPGLARFWAAPTLLWFDKVTLQFLLTGGAFLSLVLIFGVLEAPVLLVLWAFYLSLCAPGQEFMSFQWDILLLEAGFLAIFIAPIHFLPSPLRGRGQGEGVVRVLPLFLLKLLLFKLTFSSGAVKLSSGDPTWRDLTAMTYHYETQPLPTALAWYAQQLPVWFQRFSTVLMFIAELAVPFFFFFPRRIRHAAAFISILFQGLIIASGNYCFFNLLTIALSLLLLDDTFWRRSPSFFVTPARLGGLTPAGSQTRLGEVQARARTWIPTEQGNPLGGSAKEVQKIRENFLSAFAGMTRKIILVAFACVYLFFSSLQIYSSAAGRRDLPMSLLQILYAASPFRTVNNYGLFAVMTTRRVELIVEGSQDGKAWSEYEFKWKPGDVARAPRFNIPHQPRLDWQMWFASLSPFQQNPWFTYFLVRLLQNEPGVLKLLKSNPFPDSPPKFIRAMAYEYHFTTLQEKKETGNWWKRDLLGLYGPVISLK